MEQNDKKTQRVVRRNPFYPLEQRGFASLGDILALILIFLLSSLVGGLVVRLMGCAMPEMVDARMVYPADWDLTTCITYAVQMFLVLSLSLLYRRLRGSHGPLARFSARGLNPLLILGGIVVMLSMSVVMEPLLGLADAEQLPMPDPGEGVWTILSVVVLAPFCEEFLCRGILLEGLRSRYGVTVALLGSSLFFAVIHFHPVMVLNAFVLGLLFGILALRTDSLWPSILLHSFNNAVALLLMRTEFPGERFDGRPMSELGLSEMISNPATYRIVYLVAALICLRAIIVSVRRLNRVALENALRVHADHAAEAEKGHNDPLSEPSGR